jgi:hypothetical protein
MAHSARISKPGIVVLIVAVAALWVSMAAVSVGAAQGEGLCAGDVQKFCKDV